MLRKLKKGDIAYYVAYIIQTQCKITKVSDEYINGIMIDIYNHKHSLKFRKDGSEIVDCGSSGKLYFSESDYRESIKQAELTNEIKIKLNRKTYSVTILEQIISLLKK